MSVVRVLSVLPLILLGACELVDVTQAEGVWLLGAVEDDAGFQEGLSFEGVSLEGRPARVFGAVLQLDDRGAGRLSIAGEVGEDDPFEDTLAVRLEAQPQGLVMFLPDRTLACELVPEALSCSGSLPYLEEGVRVRFQRAEPTPAPAEEGCRAPQGMCG